MRRTAISWMAALAIVAGGVVFGLATPSEAGSIYLSSGVTTLIVADNSACDLDPTSGVITFSSGFGCGSGAVPIGVFNINVTTFLSKPAVGSAEFPHIDLNSVNMNSTGAGTLTLRASETGYTGAFSSFTFNVGGTSGGTATYKAWADDPNALFGMGTLLGTISGGPGAFSGSTIGLASLTAPYSLTLEAVITHGGSGIVTSFDAELKARVPEPAATALFVLGYGLTALLGGRRWMPAVA